MPPDRYSSQDGFDITLLDSQVLESPDRLATALRVIEGVCYRGDPEMAEMIAALNSRSYILEYIISGTLRVPIDPSPSPALITLPSSAGARGIREALEVDGHKVSHIHNAKYDRHHEYADPREIIIFVALRGVSVPCRHASQHPRISKEGGTVVQRSQGSSGELRQYFGGWEHLPRAA